MCFKATFQLAVTWCFLSMISAEDSLNCKHQCGDVIERFTSKSVYDGENAKMEFRIICSEESQISLAICQGLTIPQVVKISQSLSNTPVKEICAEVCSIKPVEEYDNEILPEPVIEKPMVTVSQQQDHNAVVTNEVLTAKEVCRWCQERVETGCTIASFFSESLSWLVDSLCPMLKKDLRTDFMCQSITSGISSKTAATQAAQVAHRICTAIDYCMPRSVADQCPFGAAKTAKTPFEAALDIVSIIAQSVQPYMVAKMPELRSTFLVMDETAKCYSPFNVFKAQRRDSRNAKRKNCHSLCHRVPKTFAQELSSQAAILESTREEFKSFCGGITEKKLKQRCLTLHDATDSKIIIHTLFRKQICHNLECELLNQYKAQSCILCKTNVVRRRIKKLIDYGLETISTIEEGVGVICSQVKDQRCNRFLTAQRQFMEAVKSLVSQDKLCKHMGFCN